jgi:hypothetical protein
LGERAAGEIFPDDVGFIDPAHIAGGPDGGFEFPAGDFGEDISGAKLIDVDEDRSAGGGLNPGRIEGAGDGVDPFGLGVVGPELDLHRVGRHIRLRVCIS